MKDETHDKINSEGNYLYDIDKQVLIRKNDVSVHLKAKSNIYIILIEKLYDLYTRKLSK